MPVQIGTKSSTFSNPTALLSDCHRRIEMFIKVLSTAAEIQDRSLDEHERHALDAALRYFREAAPKHNADEEESLFPRLRALPQVEVQHALADLDRLEQEHRWAAPLHAEVDCLGQQWLLKGRLADDQVHAFQSAVAKLDSMYRTHIEFEDRVLFPLAARVLSADQNAEVAQEMAKRRNLSSFALRKLQPPGAVAEAVHAAPRQIGAEADMTATRASDLLRSEHRLVETELDELLHAVKRPADDMASRLRRALSRVQRLLQPHFEKEEGVVYPYVRALWPELLSQLDEQHEYAREVERHLVELLDAVPGAPNERQRAELLRFATELYDVIQHHIVDEEDQLLRLADSMLSQEEQIALAARMKDLETCSSESAGLVRDGQVKPTSSAEDCKTTLVQAWITDLQRALEGEALTLEVVRIGVFYTAAQVSSGHVGVAFTPRDLSDTVCCPKTAASGPPSGRMSGRDVWEIANYATSPVALRRAVGVATLNALSSLAIARHGTPGGELRPGLDALEAAEVAPDDRIAMVGAFIPFIKALKGRVASLQIVDKHPEALKSEERPLWVEPGRAAEAIRQATIAIISGSALVEGGIDELLDASCGCRKVILAGPTASPWPAPFFQYGVDILGGIRVRDPQRLMTIVSEGGSGYMFDEAAEKVCIISSSTCKPQKVAAS